MPRDKGFFFMTRQLFKNTGTYLLTGFAGQGLVLVLWIILARWLPPEEIGIYSLCFFLVELFSVLGMFGLDAAITRFYHSLETLIAVLNNALVIFVSVNILVLICFMSTSPFISALIPSVSDLLKGNLFLIAGVILTNTLANFALVHYSALRKAFTYAKLQFIKIVAFFSLSILLVRFGYGIPGILFAFFVSSLLVALFFFAGEYKTVSIKTITPRLLKDILIYGFPLLLYSGSNVIVSYFGRLLLDRYADLATLGVYSFFLSLTLQMNGLWSSFNRAWTPEIFAIFSADKKNAMDQITSMVYAVSFLYLTAVGLFILVGKLFLFELLFQGVYLANINIFYILLLAPLFTGIYTVTYPLYYYENKTMRIFFLSFGLAILNIGLTFFMVKLYSQTGAALSYLLVSILTVFVFIFPFRKSMAIPDEILRWSALLSTFIVLSVITILTADSFLLFILTILCGVLMSYHLGKLSQQYRALWSFIRKQKNRLMTSTS
jgi:O-antigen/teichoic acid export membrane protein